MAQVLVGTSSWTDKTLISSGRFYPPQATSAEARLRFYASQFSMVEVDSSYYALPNVQNAVLWAERTPPDFVFDVKAFRLFTQHPTDPESLPADVRRTLGTLKEKYLYYRDLPESVQRELWRRFCETLVPLRQAGKLGVVLLQFPPWFLYGRERLDYIARCAQALKGFRVALEFRNASWFAEAVAATVLAFEREHGLIHVIVDEPQGTSASIPAVWQVTNDALTVVRLHGRNRETWQKKGLTAAERFNYLYSEPELRELETKIHSLEDKTAQVHVIFNNCYENHAQRNARELNALLIRH